MSNYLPCVEIEPARTATHAVIWLHGLGADGHDFVPIVPELKLPDSLAVRFVFPHAPVRRVTVNGGMPMPAWYDILSMGASRKINDGDLDAACESIAALIERERQRGVAAENILLVGFSQGGAVAYRTALRFPHRLAGLAALSTYRVKPGEPENRALQENIELPVFVAHGELDAVVPPALGRDGYESLLAEGLAPQWHTYRMGHEVCLDQIADLSTWMQQQLAE